jgi:ketosteroid isomerase-like protein
MAAFGREWIAAWNSHDLERVLALYTDEAEMTSDKIQALGFEAVHRRLRVQRQEGRDRTQREC